MSEHDTEPMNGVIIRRYVVFGGEDYYPDGGMSDFKGSFDSLVDAENFCTRLIVSPYVEGKKELPFEWWQVFDLVERRIVATSEHWKPP